MNEIKILMFFSDWCGPCKMTKPIVLSVSKQFNIPVDFINIDVEKEMTYKLGIKSIPTLIFKNEEDIELKRNSGYISEKELKLLIEELI